jgi:hypothetical protein
MDMERLLPHLDDIGTSQQGKQRCMSNSKTFLS